mmetsp:Transcript_75017/g.173976  ORF Transcript_75017/g.173976 Transcript_75017/m.173976 type:complete len:189 (-) Transcript_75017:201-767(-)
MADDSVTPLRVAVTSSNPEKLAAIKEVFATRWPGLPDGAVIACPADSGIPHGQPWGLQHTYEGALARLHNLKAGCDTAAFTHFASVENGVASLLRHDATEALDVACVVLERADTGERAVNFSQARPYPLAEVQERKRQGQSNADIGLFVKAWYDARSLPLSRKEQVRSAATMALAMLHDGREVAVQGV